MRDRLGLHENWMTIIPKHGDTQDPPVFRTTLDETCTLPVRETMQGSLISLITTVVTVLAISGVALDASAQTYAESQPYPGQVAVPADGGVAGGRGFRFSDEQPVVGRTVAGLGLSFGNGTEAGWIFEGALSFRLESWRAFGGANRHLYLIPEAGFAYVQHGPYAGLFAESTDGLDLQDLFFGTVGSRFGWGNTDTVDVYALARFLIGSYRHEEIAFGTVAGVGVEFYHGIFGIEVAHLWTQASTTGAIQGLRFSINLDFIRAISVVIRWIVRAGGLPAQA